MSKSKVNVFWFRRDLRLHDNRGLYHALTHSNPVLPIFIFDTIILGNLKDQNDARITFIHNCLKDINGTLRKEGSALFVFHAKPVEVFKTLVKDYQIDNVFTNRDYEPYAKNRDKEVGDFLEKQGIKFITHKDHVIFESKEVAKDDGHPYRVYTPYKSRWLENLKESDTTPLDSQKHIYNFLKTKHDRFPDLRDIGFFKSHLEIPSLHIDDSLLRSYDKTRDFPAKSGASRLGVHLRHGTLSIREAVKAGLRLNKIWLHELIWREFFIMILDNFPKVVSEEFHSKYKKVLWSYDERMFQKWCQGKTGYPIVDAGMRELNETGYMHNRVRMITASFLTKHLLIDWRWGEAYFGEKLLDYELASNNGGWQWAAGCGTDAQPYFRIFNPHEQAKKFDPQNQYIKKWVPEINSKNYPDPIIDHKFARQRAIDTFKKAVEDA